MAERTRKTPSIPEVTPQEGKDLVALKRENDKIVQTLQTREKQILASYRDMEQVDVTISPMYRPYFGNNMPVEVNGCKIYIPVDGTAYSIPLTFKRVVMQRIRSVDDHIKQMNRLADIGKNVESYAGERQLISRA